MSHDRPHRVTMQNYVSPFDDTPPPPPAYVEDTKPQQTTVSDGSTGRVVITANLLITLIIIIGMLINGERTYESIVVGARYFAFTTAAYVLIITGAFSAIVNAWQHERTERRRIDAYEDVMLAAFEWKQAVEENRKLELQAQAMPLQLQQRIGQLEKELLDRSLAADPPQRVSTFVPPYDNRSQAAFASEVEAPIDTTAQEAVAWLSSLYTDTGAPNPKKVQLTGDQADIGRLKVKVIGSKRGGGTREAGLWLLRTGVIKKVAGGYKLDLRMCPTRGAVRNLL